jgi:hypothetical protein
MVIVKAECELTMEYWLVLNPMQGNTEDGVKFGPYTSKEEARTVYNSQLCEPYKDEGMDTFNGGTKQYHKSFIKGGPMEWMNRIDENDWTTPNRYGHGLHKIIADVKVLRVIG